MQTDQLTQTFIWHSYKDTSRGILFCIPSSFEIIYNLAHAISYSY